MPGRGREKNCDSLRKPSRLSAIRPRRPGSYPQLRLRQVCPGVALRPELARAFPPLFLFGSCFRFAELVDNKVLLSLFNDPLELEVHVPLGDDEAIALAVDAVVVSNCELKQRRASGLAALAQHLDRVGTALAKVLRDVLDLSIDRAMHGLVLRHSILAGVHHLTLQASRSPPKRGSV